MLYSFEDLHFFFGFLAPLRGHLSHVDLFHDVNLVVDRGLDLADDSVRTLPNFFEDFKMAEFGPNIFFNKT